MAKDNIRKKLSTKFFAEMLTMETNLQTNLGKFEDIDKLIQYYAVKKNILLNALIVFAASCRIL